MNVLKRNNVVVKGNGDIPMMFAHGFGCDQNMWRYVTPSFEENYKVILFDHVGAGNSDLNSFSTKKYATLEGYADDVLDIAKALGLQQIIFVGHSVSAMIGVIAAQKEPALFSSLILVGPSPSYIDQDGYHGGFSRDQLDELLEALEVNHLGWSMNLAPVIMGNPDRPELGEELTNSFCRTDPNIACHFARTTFLSDHRNILGNVTHPTLILQCADDVIAPKEVGEYVHEHVRGSKLIMMKATGHCPNLSAPSETISAIKSFL
jgi:sigma-B regulation protein RsbQ